MDFIFARAEEVDRENLLQGDLLVRDDLLKGVLSHAHKYYAEAPDYTHFMILTQSCDLVRRGKRPKTRYITLAAARPMSLVVDRFVQKHKLQFEFPVALCDKSREIEGRQMLERLLHNTHDGYFFLKKESHPELVEDLCVFLELCVTVRATEHYDACLKSKIAQLDHIFAAKLGWLAGNIYSRVATPDIEEKIADSDQYKERFYTEALFGRTAWLSPAQLTALRGLVRAWRRDNQGADLTEVIAKDLLQRVPSDRDLIVERVVELLRTENLVDRADAARNHLLSDQYLKRLLARVT